MKKLFNLCVIIAMTISVAAQLPQKMSYQAVVRNASGELVKSSNIGMQISILQGSETGTAVYVETIAKMTNENGLVTLEIGGGTPVTGTFAGIDWSTGVFFIKTETDPAGGTSYSIEGTSQLLSVPYALHSKNAETAADKAYVDALQQQIDNLIDFINNQFPIPTNGLIAEWLFEDNLNDTKSTGTKFNLGIVQGSTSYLSGKVGKALFLNGATKIENTNQDLVTFINNKNPWTISFWFRYKGGVIPYKMGGKHIISIDQSAYASPYKRIWINTGDIMTSQMNNDNYGSNVYLISNHKIDDDRWFYATVIHDGSLFKLYVNNVLQEEKASINLGTDPLAAFVIGSCSQTDWATRDFYDGYIDQVRVYNRTLTESEISVLYNEGNTTNTTLTDIEGNSYNTVKIGTQIWMAENLKTTRYSDGSSIPFVNTDNDWDVLSVTSKAYGWYNNDIINKDLYGALYTWAAAMNGAISSSTDPSGIQGVCPTGWHLPSDDEWTELATYVNGAGGKLKEIGLIHWISPNEGATNETGFTGLPAGQRFIDGSSVNIGSTGTFWCSTEFSTSFGWYRGLSYINNFIDRSSYYKNLGQSVRCIKD